MRKRFWKKQVVAVTLAAALVVTPANMPAGIMVVQAAEGEAESGNVFYSSTKEVTTNNLDLVEEDWADGKKSDNVYDTGISGINITKDFTMTADVCLDEAGFTSLSEAGDFLKIQGVVKIGDKWEWTDSQDIPYLEQKNFKKTGDKYKTSVNIEFTDKTASELHEIRFEVAGQGFSGTVTFSNVKLTAPQEQETPVEPPVQEPAEKKDPLMIADFEEDAAGTNAGWTKEEGYKYDNDITAAVEEAYGSNMLNIGLDYTGCEGEGWSEAKITKTFEDGIDVSGYNTLTFELVYPEAFSNFKTKVFAKDGASDATIIDKEGVSEVSGTADGMGKALVTISFAQSTEKITSLTLGIVGVNTSFKGNVYLDNVQLVQHDALSDYIDITEKVKTDADIADLSGMAKEVKLVDADASDSAKVLAAYLLGLQESGQVIYGHQNSTFKSVRDNGKTSDVSDVTGSEAGLFGIDTLSLSGIEIGGRTREEALEASLAAAKKAYGNGSLISLSCHMPNFTSNKIKETGDAKYPYDFTECDFTESKDLTPCADYILEGGEYNPQFNAYLDIIADFASGLQEEGVPVLFRPFHENSGGWFWWGTSTSAESYRAMWRYMVNYLQSKGVHNFLYVYSPNGPVSSKDVYLERYPGDAYVDVLAFDYYDDYSEFKYTGDTFFTALKETCNVVAELAAEKGKIPAIAETGIRITAVEGKDSLLVKDNPVAGHDWYNNVINTASECKIPYFLLWANFSEDNFFIPYKVSDTKGQELINEFIKSYNNEKSIFGNGTNFYDKENGAISKAGGITLSGYSSEVTGYMVSPKDYAVIKEACSFKANVNNAKDVEFQVKISESADPVVIKAEKDTDGNIYTGALTQEILASLGKTSTGIVTLVADGRELGRASFINFNKDADVLVKGMFDNFEYYYGDNGLFQSKYGTANSAAGCSSSVTLNDKVKTEGNYSCTFGYTLAYKGSEVWTGGLGRAFGTDKTDLSEYNAVSMWVKPDGNGQKMVFQLKSDSDYEAYLSDFVKGTEAKYITIPFSSFKDKNNGNIVNPADIKGFNFWCNSLPDNYKGNKDEDGNYTVQGEIIFDDIHAVKISDGDLAKADINGIITSDEALKDLSGIQENPSPEPSGTTSPIILQPGNGSTSNTNNNTAEPGGTATGTPGTSTAPGASVTPGTEATAAPGASAVPEAAVTPSPDGVPGSTSAPQEPGTTTDIKTDENTGAVTETTTKTEGNKITVTEKVTMPDGAQNIKETITEKTDGLTTITERLNSTEANATMVTTKVIKDFDGSVVNAEASIYTGISDINSNFSAKVKIPESYMADLKEAGIDSAGIYIEKPIVDAVRDNQGRKMVVKVSVPATEGVSISKVIVTKDSISSAASGTKKLVVKIESTDAASSYTVTIPQSELKKMDGDIDITVKTKKVPGMDSASQKKINSILSANGIGADNAYVVSIPANNTKGGIKVTTPVLALPAKAGSSVYVYHYNSSTGKLEEIANSKRSVLEDNTAGLEGFCGNDYVVADKELSGKNVTTLISQAKASVSKNTIKKGSSTDVKVSLPEELVIKTNLDKSVPYGKQAAVVTYKSSDVKVAKVSGTGKVWAKGKGKATILVKVKLADGKTRTIKKNITIK